MKRLAEYHRRKRVLKGRGREDVTGIGYSVDHGYKTRQWFLRATTVFAADERSVVARKHRRCW